MKFGTHKYTKAVTVELTEAEAERLADTLNRISTRTPNPKDDAGEALYRILVEVLG